MEPRPQTLSPVHNPLAQTMRLPRHGLPPELQGPPSTPPPRRDTAHPGAEPRHGATWALLRGHLSKLGVLVPLTITDVAIDSGLTLSYKFIIDLAILPHDSHALGVILAVLAGAVTLSSALSLFRDRYYAKALARMIVELRRAAFDKLQRLPANAPIAQSSADLMSRLSADISGVEMWLGSAVHGMLVPALGVLLGTAMLFYILAWQLALVSTLIWPIVLLGPRLIAPKAAAAAYAKKGIETEILAQIEETIAARREVKAYGLEDFSRTRFGSVLDRFSSRTVDASFLGFLIERSTVISICVLQVVVVAAGSIMAFYGKISVGSLVTFLSLYWNLGWSLVVLGRSGPSVVAAISSMQRIDELLASPDEPKDPPDAKVLTGLRRDIRLTGLTFAYPHRDPVLKELNLTINQGEFVAIVGPSGSGKSTVLGVISRFLEPSQGFVSYDGMPSTILATKSIRRQMAIVSQDTFLFRLSLRENIRFGRPSATDADVIEAACEAEIHDTISKLPKGYDTVVGEGGFSLSGGQRQRIAIARALLRNAPILLLDEATSALDPATESSVNETLRRAGRGRTTIFVTHRLSGIVQADRIVVVQGGNIAEQGPHNELLAKEGLYAELWRKQQGFILSDDGALAQVTAERLRDIPLLRPLSEEQLTLLAPQFVSMRVSPGQAVINEGERASLFYIVARGLVMVSRRDEYGDDVEVARLGDGDQFGELALLNDSPRTATVTTRTDCLFLTLNRTQFLELLRTTPDVRAMVERIAGERAQPTPSTAGSWQGATVVM